MPFLKVRDLNCENLLGIISLIIALLSLVITTYANFKQYRLQQYDRRLEAYHKICRFLDFITYLELYKGRMCDENNGIDNGMIEFLNKTALTMNDVYAFYEVKFVMPCYVTAKFENIKNGLYNIVHEFIMIKESAKNNEPFFELSRELYAEIDKIKEQLIDIRSCLEGKLQC